MVNVPARCHRCGEEFSSRAYNLGGGNVNVQFSGNRASCPNCGALAQVADFNRAHQDSEGRLVVTDGPQWSIDLIERMQLVLTRIASEDVEEPEELLREELPEVAEPISRAVDAMSERAPRTSRRTLLKKMAAYLATTPLIIAEGALQERANDALGISEDPVSPDEMRKIFREELQKITDTGRLPAKPKPKPKPKPGPMPKPTPPTQP